MRVHYTTRYNGRSNANAPAPEKTRDSVAKKSIIYKNPSLRSACGCLFFKIIAPIAIAARISAAACVHAPKKISAPPASSATPKREAKNAPGRMPIE